MNYKDKIQKELDKHDRQWCDAICPRVAKYGQQADKEIKELKDAIFKHGIEITRLILIAESLERGYDEIVEIYANIEGFIPETAPEGYQQKIIRDMYEVATKYT